MWDIACSNDPQQRFLYVADGSDKGLGAAPRLARGISSARGGRWPGHFYGVGNIAVDRKATCIGRTYEGKRLQKFIFKGLGAPAAGGRP